jgi:hypothetical protein
MKLLDETVAVVDDLDGYMSSYKIQLNVRLYNHSALADKLIERSPLHRL